MNSENSELMEIPLRRNHAATSIHVGGARFSLKPSGGYSTMEKKVIPTMGSKSVRFCGHVGPGTGFYSGNRTVQPGLEVCQLPVKASKGT